MVFFWEGCLGLLVVSILAWCMVVLEGVYFCLGYSVLVDVTTSYWSFCFFFFSWGGDIFWEGCLFCWGERMLWMGLMFRPQGTPIGMQ